MTEVLGSNVGHVETHGVLDLIAMVGGATAINQVPLPVVGTKNVVSGIAKMILGGWFYKGGRLQKDAAGAVVLAGAADVASTAVKYLMGGKSSGSGDPLAGW